MIVFCHHKQRLSRIANPRHRAYLKSGEDFNYTANMMKLAEVDNPTKFVKEQFQKVFKKNNYKIYDDVFSENSNAFLKFDIKSKAEFIRKANKTDDIFYNFIKIE